MLGFYCSHLPEFVLSGFHRQAAWHSEAVAFTLSPTNSNISRRGCRGCYGGGAQWGGLGFRLWAVQDWYAFNYFYIFDIPEKKNSLEKKVLLLTVRKRITVLKDFCGSLLPVTRKWGKLNSLPRHHPGTGFICRPTNTFFLLTNTP